MSCAEGRVPAGRDALDVLSEAECVLSPTSVGSGIAGWGAGDGDGDGLGMDDADGRGWMSDCTLGIAGGLDPDIPVVRE